MSIKVPNQWVVNAFVAKQAPAAKRMSTVGRRRDLVQINAELNYFGFTSNRENKMNQTNVDAERTSYSVMKRAIGGPCTDGSCTRLLTAKSSTSTVIAIDYDRIGRDRGARFECRYADFPIHL